MTKLLKHSALMTTALLVLALSFSIGVRADGSARTGEFVGLSNHSTNGNVTVEKTDEGYVITLQDNFSFDGAPDPKVALGNDGKYDSSTLLAPLKSNKGKQSYLIPASIDATQFNEVYIWCEKYSVGLGVAALNQ